MIDEFSACNPIWQRNSDALQRRDAELFHRLAETTIDPTFLKIGRSPEGKPVLGMRRPNGSFLALDDPAEPRQKADEWLLRVKNFNLKTGHLMVVGVGSGYCALSVFENSLETAYLWFVEPNLALLKAVFHLLDFTALIESPRVRFAAGKTPEEAAVLPFDGPTGNRMRAQGIQIQYPPAALQIYGNYIQELKAAVQRASQVEAIKLRTMETQGRYVLANSAANLPAILQGAPFLRLLGAAAGVPALVVGPGPSLEEQLERIQAARDRVLLVAIDTALRSLHRFGIVPDIVASADYSDLNARHFEGVPIGDSVLVASPTVHSSIVRRYWGRVYFFNHHATRFIQSLESLRPLGAVHLLGSTAHAAYRIARLMGCSPIIFVGIDLSFPGDKQYAQGTIQNDLKLPEQQRDLLIEVPANDGALVKTTLQFKAFCDSLGQIIRETRGAAITTSLHGAQIPGCPYQSLNDVLAEIPSGAFDKRFLRRLAIPNQSYKKTALMAELQVWREKLVRFEERLLGFIQQAQRLEESNNQFGEELEGTLEPFFALQESENFCFSLCTPLCPYSTILLFGSHDQFQSANSLPYETKTSLKVKLIHALFDFQSAVRETLKAIGKILDDLSAQP